MTRPERSSRTRRSSRGVSLLFVLIGLVILSLGAVALVRSVHTGNLVIGNLSFQQDALVASAAGTEQAIAWLQERDATGGLNDTNVASGYYSSSIDALDPTGNRTSAGRMLPLVDWLGNDCANIPQDKWNDCSTKPFTGARVNGNRVQWVILRMCEQPNQPAAGANICVRPAARDVAAERGRLQPGGRVGRSIASPYYRIVVRVQGPRNTVSITETLVHL